MADFINNGEVDYEDDDDDDDDDADDASEEGDDELLSLRSGEEEAAVKVAPKKRGFDRSRTFRSRRNSGRTTLGSTYWKKA
jgi:hypothetical protein